MENCAVLQGMSDDRDPRSHDDNRPFDRPGPLLIMLWAAAAAMLLLVGLWITG
jgi:hypothetical protein